MSAAPLRRDHEAPVHRSASASARTTTARPIPSSRPVDLRPRLRAVRTPEQARSLAPFAWACVLIIVGALAAVLLINTTMASGAYERRELKIEIANLHQERSALVSALEANSAPGRLADAAAGLGMVPHETLGFVYLGEGAVLEPGGR